MSRKKGSGTLVLRGKYWLAIWTVNGKKFSRSTKCTEKAEAEKRLAEYVKVNAFERDVEKLEYFKAKIEAGKADIEAAKREERRIPLKDMFDTWTGGANAPTLAARTLEEYGYHVQTFVTWCAKRGILSMDAVKYDDAKDFLEDRLARDGSGSYNSHLFILRRLWNELADSAHLEENPFAKFKNRKTHKKPKAELTGDELLRLLAVLSSKDAQTKVVFGLGLFAGLRLSDCCKLKVSNIDFSNATLNVVPSKTKRFDTEVHIPIHDDLKRLLMQIDWKLKEPGDYVCPDWAEDYRTYVVSRRVRKIFDEAKIPKTDEKGGAKGFHSLRVCFVTKMLNSGVPVAVVQSFTGHSTVKMAYHYVREDMERQKKAIASLSYVPESLKKALPVRGFVEKVELPCDLVEALRECGATPEQAVREWLKSKTVETVAEEKPVAMIES